MDYILKVGEKRSRQSDSSGNSDPKRFRSDDTLGGDSDIKISSNDNHIYYYASVNKKSVLELNSEIKRITRNLQRMAADFNINPPPIYLHINSYGGSVFAAFSVIDTIQYNPIPIYTIIEGAAASAATMISVHGKKRYITKSSHMLVHQLSSGFWGKMAEFEDEIKNLDNLMKAIKKIYRKKSNIPKDKLDEVLKHDLWWKSKKCLKYGLVDKVIKSPNEIFDENVRNEL